MEILKETKIAVHSEEESRRIQEKLFELGCKWMGGKIYIHLDSRYLYISDELIITEDEGDKEFFDSHEYIEIYVKDLLNLKKEIKKFDKISLKFTSNMRKDMFGELGNAYVEHIKTLAEQELYERGSQDE